MAQAEQELRASLPHTIPGNYIPGRFDKGTNTIRFARYADLDAATTALTEGTNPTPVALTIDSEAFTATQYGNIVEVSDLAAVESPQDLFALSAERIGRNAALTIDTIVRDIITAGSSVVYSGAATSRATVASTATLTGALVKKMFWKLQNLNVPRFPDGTYHAIITPGQGYDLETDTANGGWIDAHKYADAMPLMTGEIGRFGGVRFIAPTSQAKIFTTAGASSADVHAGLFFGPGSYVIGDLQTLQVRFVPPGGDHSDVLGLIADTGWKVSFGAALLTKAGPRLVRLETGATSL